MGHERLGILPRTRRWKAIVADLALMAETQDFDVGQLARRTIANVRKRYQKIHNDQGIKAAFGFLIALSAPDAPSPSTSEHPRIDFEGNPSALRLASDLAAWVEDHAGSREYAELAKRAASDAIAFWTRTQTKQCTLFDKDQDARRIWAAAASAGGFCEIARHFFAKFTERYLNYFLEREASAEFRTIHDRNKFGALLQSHLDTISKHAFETSKITQSFAAGWFNKHARGRRPSDAEIDSFLAVAFAKVDEELRREGEQ